MSKSKISQVSTNSASKQATFINSPTFKDPNSKEFPVGKSELSVEFNQSFNNQDSDSLKNLTQKELNLLAGLEALEISAIPNENVSISCLKSSFLCEDKKNPEEEEKPMKLKPLSLETSQIKQAWWCQSCITPETKTKNQCVVM